MEKPIPHIRESNEMMVKRYSKVFNIFPMTKMDSATNHLMTPRT